MKYRKEIDGLRAIAVLPVVLFHAGFDLFVGGFVGVDIFFVISGYLITTLIIREKENGSFTFKGFYLRRVRRILPALYFMIIVISIFSWFWMLPHQFKEFGQSMVATVTFLSNFFFTVKSGYFANISDEIPLLHTWSLAVEEQYYLIFPIFFLALLKFKKNMIISILTTVFLTSLIFSAFWNNNFVFGLVSNYGIDWVAVSNSSFFSSLTRAWEILLGSIVAVYLFNNSDKYKNGSSIVSFIGVLIIAFSIFYFDKHVFYPGYYALLPCIGTVLIIIFCNEKIFIGKLISLPFFVGIGQISYSVYLWHQPIFSLFRINYPGAIGSHSMMVVCFLIMFLGYLSWRFIEIPFRYSSFSKSEIILPCGIIVSILILSAGMLIHLKDGFPLRMSGDALAMYQYGDPENRSKFCSASNNENASLENCEIGAATDVPATFVLVGDSHANALVKELGEKANILGVKGLAYSYVGCPSFAESYKYFGEECIKHNLNAFNRVISDNSIKTVILNNYWTAYVSGVNFNNGEGGVSIHSINTDFINDVSRNKDIINVIKKQIDNLLSHNKNVILIYPTPEAGWHVPNYLAKLIDSHRYNELSPLSTNYQIFLDRNKIIYSEFETFKFSPKLIRIKPDNLFCNTTLTGRCLVEKNGIPLYMDGHHLSNYGASIVVEEFIDYIK